MPSPIRWRQHWEVRRLFPCWLVLLTLVVVLLPACSSGADDAVATTLAPVTTGAHERESQ
jgi:hypothetical protein